MNSTNIFSKEEVERASEKYFNECAKFNSVPIYDKDVIDSLSVESLQFVKQQVEQRREEYDKSTEMYIICQMALEYLKMKNDEKQQRKETKSQLPRTLQTIKDLDTVLYKVGARDIQLEELSDYERMLLDEMEMAIASTLYSEAPEWAINIAKYIMIMANLDDKKIKAKIEWE